jgi:hypothetical protein
MQLLRAFLVCLAIAFFTWFSFRYFPGHTYLQSDTQIYLPMLERLDSPGFLARDLVATRPHVSFTIYDEVSLTLHRVAHLDFEAALVAQQLLFRAAALFGIYLIATSVGVTPVYALLVAAFLNLGAALLGPAVLLVEYEPIPRGYSFGLILLALGLIAHGWHLSAALLGGLAMLYHPPTAAPFWGIILLGFVSDRQVRREWRPVLLVIFITGLLLANLAQLQPDIVESQNLFGRLSGRMIEIQHYRTRYSWVSLWADRDIWHYSGLAVCGLWATSRIWPELTREMKWFFVGLPLAGILSVPLSYLLLERWHFAITSQFQPARTLLYTVALSSIACALAAMKAARRRRFFETFACLLPVLAMPITVRFFDLIAVRDVASIEKLAGWISLSAAVAALCCFVRGKWTQVSVLAMPLVAGLVIPRTLHVENYPEVDKKPVTALARWARDTTWGSSMFMFPGAGHDPYPGIFRALSERALYVDWKSGGQVNYFESFADEWYARFRQTMTGVFTAERLQDMLSLPIDYYAFRRPQKVIGIKPVYENEWYFVYDTQDLRNSSTSLRLGTED